MARQSPSALDLAADFFELSPYAELADALQARVESIVLTWTDQIRVHVPAARGLPFGELKDNCPVILSKMSDALRMVDPQARRELMERSPLQGITRFQQHYDIRELMTEDRLLRRVVIEQVQETLARLMTAAEQVALNVGLDAMLQQAVVAFVEHQGEQLRSAAESELKYLSFLSHDLNNNLSNVTVWLQVLKTQLAKTPQFAEEMTTLDTAQEAILTTIGGMGRLLQAERLRKGSAKPKVTPVNLRTLIANETRQVVKQAARKGLAITVDVPREAEVESDPELITLVLQNLIGNAVKYSTEGSVRIRALRQPGKETERWAICVSDEGPGISAEHLQRIFDAFQRGDMHGTVGVGLGLAIASQAARLLGAELTVESAIGAGSAFTLVLPDTCPDEFTPAAGAASPAGLPSPAA